MDNERLLPKLIVTTIDGVWTDGCVYYGADGVQFKKYNTSDYAGVLLAHRNNIAVCMISDEKSDTVKQLAEQMRADYLLSGCTNKFSEVKRLCGSHHIAMNSVAYLGAELSDILMMKLANWSGAPSSAPDFVQKYVNNKLVRRGGEGAFTEYVEKLLGEDVVLEVVLQEMKKQRE